MVNLYGRARRIALYRNIGIIAGCVIAIAVIISIIFSSVKESTVSTEYDLLRKYFVDRGYSCEMLNTSGSKCNLSTDTTKYVFYRYDDGFEYNVKTNSFNLSIIHRLDKKDQLTFKTTSEAFEGFKNQKFICDYDNNVLGKVDSCVAEVEDIKLDVKSYLGVIEQSQVDVTNAINSSGYSLDNLLSNYEWIKK
jgi:ABC-type transport system involved in multi-copper enzyme maturation permease subunit